MRWVICTLVVLAFTPRALADDLDNLRGSQPVGPATFTRWAGFYFGGDFGYSDANADFAKSTQTPIAYALRQTLLEDDFAPSLWPVLGRDNRGGTGFGGFAGYNTQWQDLIIGVEANYQRASLHLVAPSSPISRMTGADSGGNTYNVTLTASGTLDTIEYASLRARAGWIFGNILPYAFVGPVLGEANVAITANVQGVQNPSSNGLCSGSANPPCVPFSATSTSARNSAVLYGVVAGGGVDVALTPNFFLRGELEYVAFTPLSGVSSGIASARVGAGLKF